MIFKSKGITLSISKLSEKWISLALYVALAGVVSGCVMTAELDNREYNKILSDLQGKRSFPVMRDAFQVPYLVKALKSKSEDVRYNSAQDLKAIGPEAKDATIALLKRLEDPSARVASMSYAAIKEIGAPIVPPKETSSWSFRPEPVNPLPLLYSHLKSKNSLLRARALAILSRMKESAKPAVPRVLALLRDENSTVREQAQLFLAGIEADITPELHNALKSEIEDERASAAIALGSRKARSSISQIEPLLEDSSSSVRFAAAEALAMLGGGSQRAKVAEVLTSSLGDISDSKFNSVAKLLKKIGYGHRVNAYRNSVEKSRKQRMEMAREQGDMKAIIASNKVRAKLLDDAKRLKMARLKTKSNLRRAKLQIPRLVARLSSGGSKQRLNAVDSLKEMGEYSTSAVDALIEALNNEKAFVRSSAARSLGELRSERAIQGLSFAAGDENSVVQESSATSLLLIGTPEAEEAVSKLPEALQKVAAIRAKQAKAKNVTPLVRCSEARSLCRMILQQSGATGRELNSQSAQCAWRVQPGC